MVIWSTSGDDKIAFANKVEISSRAVTSVDKNMISENAGRLSPHMVYTLSEKKLFT